MFFYLWIKGKTILSLTQIGNNLVSEICEEFNINIENVPYLRQFEDILWTNVIRFMCTSLMNSHSATVMKESGHPDQHGGEITPEFLQTAVSSNSVSLCESVPAYLPFPTFSMLKKHIRSQEILKVLQISKNGVHYC